MRAGPANQLPNLPPISRDHSSTLQQQIDRVRLDRVLKYLIGYTRKMPCQVGKMRIIREPKLLVSPHAAAAVAPLVRYVLGAPQRLPVLD